MSYDNTNRGSIWKNDKKEKDTHPDFTGTLDVDGVQYWVSAWKRRPDASHNAPALSFSIKPKEEKPAAATQQPSHTQPPAATGGGNFDDFSDDIPFNRISAPLSLAS